MDVFVCARWENTIGALWGYCRERIGLDSRFDWARTRGGRDWSVRVGVFEAAGEDLGELHSFSFHFLFFAPLKFESEECVFSKP